jgi:formamidopyrimidine-DNA glycosylase
VPELPEVETVRRSLVPGLFDGTITDVESGNLALRRRRLDKAGLRALVGSRFVAARRHGKYLLLDTSNAHTLLVHLGMSGRLLLVNDDAPRAPHTHLVLQLSSKRQLRYVDPRRFGMVRPYATDRVERSEEMSALGPDPLGASFDTATFAAAMAGTRRDLKSALLDQGNVAGLGNIYVAEALFLAKLSPRRRADHLRRAEADALYAAVVRVLQAGVDNRGTSFSDYVDADGNKGENQNALWVYGRGGEPCRVCGRRIATVVQGGRTTFYCPQCQRGR